VNAQSYVVGSDRSQRVPAVALGCASFLVPLACERLGLEAPSFAFKEGTLVLLPRLVSFPPVPTLLFLVVSHVALLATAAFFVGRFKDVLSETEGRLYMHTWHLRQFVPGHARGALSTPADPLDYRAVEDRVLRRRAGPRHR
jgi:hypothetical protein